MLICASLELLFLILGFTVLGQGFKDKFILSLTHLKEGLIMEPDSIAYIVVGALVVIKIAVYMVYKRVIKKAELDEVANKSDTTLSD